MRAGCFVIYATTGFTDHAFVMVGRAINRKSGAIQVDELIADVLRVFAISLIPAFWKSSANRGHQPIGIRRITGF